MSGRKSNPQRKFPYKEVVTQITAENRVTAETKNRAYVEKLRAEIREYERKASKLNSYKPLDLNEGNVSESLQLQPEQQLFAENQPEEQQIAENTEGDSTCWYCNRKFSATGIGTKIKCPHCGKSNFILGQAGVKLEYGGTVKLGESKQQWDWTVWPKAICLSIVLLAGIGLVGYLGLSLVGSSASNPETPQQSDTTLTVSPANGQTSSDNNSSAAPPVETSAHDGNWWLYLASDTEKRDLCQTYADEYGKTADFYYDAFNSFYDPSVPSTLTASTAQMAPMFESAAQ